MDSNRDLFCPETPSLKVPELVELALAALGLPVVVLRAPVLAELGPPMMRLAALS